MDKINWVNGTTKLNKTTMDQFQDNIEAGIEEVRNYVEEVIGIETDTFSTSSTYNVNDIVIYENKLYKCTTAVTTAGEFDDNDWTEVSIKSLIDSANTKIAELNSKVANIGTYSTTETVIGTWFGKPLYRKVIQLSTSSFGTGTATEGATITIAHNISNIEIITHKTNILWIRNTNPLQFRPFPSVLFSNSAWDGQVYYTNANIIFEIGATLLNQIRTNTSAIYAILEYTKTTD